MNLIQTFKTVCIDVYYSFPVQLLVNHVKKNQILLVVWLVLFGIVTQNIGSHMGVPYLFLDPEYLNKVDYKGFIIVGAAMGIFLASFHITTYILDSSRFPFLGSVKKPFSKFCLNNSIIPILFLQIYVTFIIKFQLINGFQNKWEIFIEVFCFLTSLFLTLIIIFLYFNKTNKDALKSFTEDVNNHLKRYTINKVNVLNKINNLKKNKYRVDSYLNLNLSVTKTPVFKIYDKQALLKVFDQNHLNAVIFEIVVIVIILLLGLFRDHAIIQIPAAASTILFFSMFIMFTGAFSYWLRSWAMSALILGLLIFNFFVKHNFINTEYQAYGIDYHKKPVDFSIQKLNEINSSKNLINDIKSTTEILENWKAKFKDKTKPTMVFVCASGGGQRAAVWTMRTLQYVDEQLAGKLMDHTILMTGASGGILGAAYYRELCLQKAIGKDINLYDKKYFDNIAKDVLNPIIFSLVVNDMFFRFQKFSDGKYEYLKDRGYAFEQKLNENTEQILDKPLSAYRLPEYESKIPMLLCSPTVINDGRKLFISPQNVSYFTNASLFTQRKLNQKIKGIEFTRMFEAHDADNLRYLSALRMSATFPYVTPNVNLPSYPVMEIMDAGLTDNYGIRDAIQFLYVFREWISKNTGGVVIISIRDSQKEDQVEHPKEVSLFQKLLTPIGSIYNTWDYLMDYNNDNLLEYCETWYKGELEVINFEYIPKPKYWQKLIEKNIDPIEVEETSKKERAALSWHLTTREKESLSRTIKESNNQAALEKLQKLLK